MSPLPATDPTRCPCCWARKGTPTHRAASCTGCRRAEWAATAEVVVTRHLFGEVIEQAPQRVAVEALEALRTAEGLLPGKVVTFAVTYLSAAGEAVS